MPATGTFPVVQPSGTGGTDAGSDATTAAFPAADFPTEQHSNVPHHALPHLGAHDPAVTAGHTQGTVPPQYPGGPVAPAYQPPRYADAPRRHPGEIPLLILVILTTAVIYVGSLVLVLLGSLSSYALVVLALPLILFIGRGLNWASPRVQGIQMTPTQFPEGYQIVRDAAARYGLREVPDAFVVIGNGQINAFASGHTFRRFVVVYSDLFEIGGKARDPEALAYIIGHEVGHIAAGHVSYWRQIGSFAMSYLPVIGPALSRSQEYTADNYGYFNQPSGVTGGMGLLGAGKYLGKQIDFDQLADRATTDRGFFTWLVNLMASHPVLTWRAAALRNRTKAGSLFFAPGQTVRGVGGGAVVPSGPVPTFNTQEVLAPAPGQQPAHQLPPGGHPAHALPPHQGQAPQGQVPPQQGPDQTPPTPPAPPAPPAS
ncbi:hypothetical protein TTY48_41050 [Tsukamurella sp. TY48]|nr:hypothetical protein TTY48_41050 [Tsukamurella sp. TY48]